MKLRFFLLLSIALLCSVQALAQAPAQAPGQSPFQPATPFRAPAQAPARTPVPLTQAQPLPPAATQIPAATQPSAGLNPSGQPSVGQTSSGQTPAGPNAVAQPSAGQPPVGQALAAQAAVAQAVLELPLPKVLALPVPNLAGKLTSLAAQAAQGSREAALGLGLCQVMAQRLEEGRNTLAQARRALPLMDGWARLFIGLAKYKQRDFQGALAELLPLTPPVSLDAGNSRRGGPGGIDTAARPDGLGGKDGTDGTGEPKGTDDAADADTDGTEAAARTSGTPSPGSPGTPADSSAPGAKNTPVKPDKSATLFPASEALLLSAYCLEGLSRPAEALPRYRRFLELADTSFKPVALWRMAVCSAALSDFPGAEAALRELILASPNAASADKALPLAQSLFAQGKSAFQPDAPEALLERARVLIDRGQASKALALLKPLAMTPQADQAQVLYLTGKAQYAKRNTQTSVQTLEDAVSLSPRSDVAPWAMYHQARGYWRLAGPEDYRRMEELLIAAPRLAPERADLAEACRRLLMLSRLEQGRFAQALETAAEIVDRGMPQSEITEQAALLTGLIKMALDDPAGAGTALEDFLDRYPKSAEAAGAHYWLGRAFEAQDDPIQASGWYRAVLTRWPNGYYGSLAAPRLTALGQTPPPANAEGECPLPALAAPAPAGNPAATAAGRSQGLPDGTSGSKADGPSGSQAARVSGQGSEAVRLGLERAGGLERATLPELAERELSALAVAYPRDGVLALHLATLETSLGNHMAAVRAASRAFPGCLAKGTRTELAPLRDIFYPRRFAEIIAQHLAGSGVDTNLLCGLIRQESFFEQNAVSPAGAVGLMQLMPATAKSLAAHMGDTAFNPATLRDPAVNIRYGVRFFLDRFAEYNGNLAYTLASYNAGRVKLKVWMENLGNIDRELFVEFIPYTETREYVKRIVANQEMYAKLY